MNYEEIKNKYELGSMERLEAISRLNLGAISDAAKRVMEKRNRRKELMRLGFDFETIRIIINEEFKN